MKTDQQKASKIQEKRLVKDLKAIDPNAHDQAGSGNQWYAKSDVITDMLRIEAKTKVNQSKSFSVKREWLDKVRDETRGRGQIPVLAFSFGDREDFFVLRKDDIINLILELQELRREKTHVANNTCN